MSLTKGRMRESRRAWWRFCGCAEYQGCVSELLDANLHRAVTRTGTCLTSCRTAENRIRALPSNLLSYGQHALLKATRGVWDVTTANNAFSSSQPRTVVYNLPTNASKDTPFLQVLPGEKLPWQSRPSAELKTLASSLTLYRVICPTNVQTRLLRIDPSYTAGRKLHVD